LNTDWRSEIIRNFIPELSRLTIVADPDGLLQEEVLAQKIREKGFDLLQFDDPIAFRYEYESRYRSQWDNGVPTELVVALRLQSSDINTLPYDIIKAGRVLSFSLSMLFPNLSPAVVEAIDKSDLDPLFKAQELYRPDRMGDRNTKDFVLRHVYEIPPETIKSAGALMRLLIQQHYRHRIVPEIIDSHLVQMLKHTGLFEEWPLEAIVRDRQQFFLFLQERWPVYLSHITSAETCADASATYSLELFGPRLIPFNEVWELVDNLFAEGILFPVKFPHVLTAVDKRIEIGILHDKQADAEDRFKKLADIIEREIPEDSAKYTDWQQTALRWGELLNLWFSGLHLNTGLIPAFQHLQRVVDTNFVKWLELRYAGLHNQPAVNPVMVHHVPRNLNRIREDNPEQKIALIVVDGLAVHQWLSIRQVISDQSPDLTFREDAIFAWLPTTTAVSRQAIFSGKPPVYFPNSIHDTSKESGLWTQFWAGHGLSGNNVAYLKGLGEQADIEKVEELICSQQIRVVGLVVDKVDRIMHGMEMGSLGMQNQIALWAQTGYLADLIDRCLSRGFTVVVTSDHGNVEAKGIGRISEGAIADLRGERVRIYPDESLRATVRSKCPTAIEGATVGLPSGYFPLYACGRSAFILNGAITVCHGGPSIEEVMVPFVRVERKKR
jgi:hypothetical protein